MSCLSNLLIFLFELANAIHLSSVDNTFQVPVTFEIASLNDVAAEGLNSSNPSVLLTTENIEAPAKVQSSALHETPSSSQSNGSNESSKCDGLLFHHQNMLMLHFTVVEGTNYFKIR